MSDFNIPRYTANGYSHASLKKQVNSLVKQEQTSRSSARKKVAESIGYKSWKEILVEPRNLDRDRYFANAFSDKASYQLLFESYLKNNNLDDTLPNYREFLLRQEEVNEALRDKSAKVRVKTFNIESTTKELLVRMNEFGPEALLPQHLPDYLLFPISEALSHWLDDPSSIESEGDEEPDKFYLIKCVLEGVKLLKRTKILLKNPKRSKQISIPEDEIINGMECYSIQLYLERLRRNTKLEISLPTLENVLDMETAQTVKFPQDVFDMLMKEIAVSK